MSRITPHNAPATHRPQRARPDGPCASGHPHTTDLQQRVVQLHRVDPQVPLADQIGELKALQDEGKIREIGMSQCTVEQLGEARQIADIVSVQSRFNVIDRSANDILEVCERDGLAFIPWAPVAQGGFAAAHQALADIARAHQCTVGQVAIAWLLHFSPAMLPILARRAARIWKRIWLLLKFS